MKKKGLVFAFLLCFLLPITVAAQLLVGGGSIRYEPKGAGRVLFDHEKHVAANGRKCSACHFGIFQMKKGSNKMDMDKITKGHFCGVCHDGRTAFNVEDKSNCNRCHK